MLSLTCDFGNNQIQHATQVINVVSGPREVRLTTTTTSTNNMTERSICEPHRCNQSLDKISIHMEKIFILNFREDETRLCLRIMTFSMRQMRMTVDRRSFLLLGYFLVHKAKTDSAIFSLAITGLTHLQSDEFNS